MNSKQKELQSRRFFKQRLEELKLCCVEGWDTPYQFPPMISNITYGCSLLSRDYIRKMNYHLKIHKLMMNIIKKMFRFHRHNPEKWKDFLDLFDPVENPRKQGIMNSLETIYNNYLDFRLKEELYGLIRNQVDKNTSKKATLDKYSGDLYIVQLREDVISNRYLYKIGMTNRTMKERIRGYPKGSRIQISIHFNQHTKTIKEMETQWITLCKGSSSLRNCPERGNEYFEGDLNEIKEYLYKVSSL